MRNLGWLLAFGLCLAAGATVRSSHAAEDQSTTPPAIDPKVKAILERLSKTVVKAKSFSVNIEGEMKMAVKGTANVSTAKGRMAVERPNKLALRSEGRMEGAAIADGKTIHSYLAFTHRYTEEEQTSPIADLGQQQGIGIIDNSLGGGIVLALLAEDPAAYFLDGVTRAVYVGREKLADVSVDHMRFEQKQMDWELWVQAEGDALPLKQTTDLTKSMQGRGKGEFTALLRDWKLNVELPAETFKFTPPAGAEKADSLFSESSDAEEEDKLLGKPAPAMKLPLLGGGTLDLGALKGKNIVVLDFWATWCGPCVMSLPLITQATADYKDKGVLFYAVNQQEDADTIKAFLKSKKLTISVALDKNGRAGETFGVEGIPHTVIVGKDGTIQATHTGYSPQIKAELKKQLDVLIAGKNLAKPSAARTKPTGSVGKEDATTRP